MASWLQTRTRRRHVDIRDFVVVHGKLVKPALQENDNLPTASSASSSSSIARGGEKRREKQSTLMWRPRTRADPWERGERGRKVPASRISKGVRRKTVVVEINKEREGGEEEAVKRVLSPPLSCHGRLYREEKENSVNVGGGKCSRAVSCWHPLNPVKQNHAPFYPAPKRKRRENIEHSSPVEGIPVSMETTSITMETTSISMETTFIITETNAPITTKTTSITTETTPITTETTPITMETTSISTETTSITTETTSITTETPSITTGTTPQTKREPVVRGWYPSFLLPCQRGGGGGGGVWKGGEEEEEQWRRGEERSGGGRGGGLEEDSLPLSLTSSSSSSSSPSSPSYSCSWDTQCLLAELSNCEKIDI